MAGNVHFDTRECKVCGKSFVPAPYHVYKVIRGKDQKTWIFCSWTCYRKVVK